MHKIMALDVGTKRIGVALSDYLQVIANPCTCIQREPEQKAIEEITKIAKENRVEKIVVGVPYNMDGTLGFQGENCIEFSQKLIGFDIILEDERLTSEEAEERLKNRKVDFRKNKGLVDIESACIILEQYLGK
ncbi:MAG: Holliday junction resolvase RuvX [Acinetobacter sp.]|nr:Holliday junction resolvase RuvX [Acinetobacter sp.]